MERSDSVSSVLSGVAGILHKTREESMSAYFLQSSVLSAKLSSKLTDIYLVLAISSHYPQSLQTALMSANVQTVPEALSLPNNF
jgi:hypothetical protein